MGDDPCVVQFRKPDPPEQSGRIIVCNEGEELRRVYDRNDAAAGARARIAARGRLARLRGAEISRPELRVVDEPREPTPRGPQA